jgi:hypothetical protein
MGKLLGGSLGTGEAREGKFGGGGHGGAVRRSGAAGWHEYEKETTALNRARVPR